MRQFVLKVHQLCNLACDHCYVYEHADQTWRDRPAIMSAEVVRQTATRIAEHAARRQLSAVGVVLHGGEPLLLGATRLREVLTILHRSIGATTALDVRLQTNAIRLTEPMAELLLEFGVRVGVSLDGDEAANDRHRRYRNGASSHDRTLRGLALLRSDRYRPAYAGILCTIDARNDPIAVYEALLAEEPPRIDLLLPHATWDNPPEAPHADWLIRLYRRWLADGRPVPIRLFDSLRATAAGRPSATEAVGIDRGDVAVVESDGSWEQPDSMKTTFHGAAATGLTVFTASADELLAAPAMRVRQSGLAGLSATCRACPVVRQCGGGLFAHRFSSATGFDNPSVYCADLKGLIAAMNSETPVAWTGQPGLPESVFDDLASGGGGSDAVARLAAAQESITRALLVAVADAPEGRTAAAAWELLSELDRRAPEAVRRVLTHPFVRVWAVRVLSGAGGTDRLADLAAAVAVLARADVEVAVRPRDGGVHLPTLGTLSLANGVTSVNGAHDHVLTPTVTIARDDLTVRLEDADPYRDCHGWPAVGGLTPAQVRDWERVLGPAWQTVTRDAPGYAAGVAAGLTTITPLVPDAETLRSATSRQAFGATGVAWSPDPRALAILLVHEFQHTKLGALLDLVDLVEPDATDLLRVGWRPDARPAESALQGTYAHLAVADMWRARAERGEPGTAEHYARYRGWIAEAVIALGTSDALTEPGRRFVDRLAATIEKLPV
ncbi:FxsB family cyclophane-forming radical SAM/SPASM peptide maturase [Actinoplanes sp. NPDC051470]|uniref:FxsB family cyclophane-forming radical SAM/SPASM peptide maturase n=1 Tax=Actinoplanes sp. NPDC051470 TaxID=3157224 RepID=UPI003425B4E6